VGVSGFGVVRGAEGAGIGRTGRVGAPVSPEFDARGADMSAREPLAWELAAWELESRLESADVGCEEDR